MGSRLLNWPKQQSQLLILSWWTLTCQLWMGGKPARLSMSSTVTSKNCLDKAISQTSRSHSCLPIVCWLATSLRKKRWGMAFASALKGHSPTRSSIETSWSSWKETRKRRCCAPISHMTSENQDQGRTPRQTQETPRKSSWSRQKKDQGKSGPRKGNLFFSRTKGLKVLTKAKATTWL